MFGQNRFQVFDPFRFLFLHDFLLSRGIDVERIVSPKISTVKKFQEISKGVATVQTKIWYSQV